MRAVHTIRAIAALFLGSISAMQAAAFTVTNTADSGAGSLRQAITDANTVSGDNTILFNIAAPGPHTIDLNSDLPPITTNLQILNDASGAGPVTVRRSTTAGTPDFRIFTVMPATTVVLSGLTLANGHLVNESGGAIWMKNADLTIRNCTLTGNGGRFGGALYCSGVNGTARATLVNCTLTNNVSLQAVNGGGGAIYSTSLLDFFGPNPNAPRSAAITLTDCILSANSADTGGAIGQAVGGGGVGTATLTRCVLSGNTAASLGGGIFNQLSPSGGATATINVDACTFSENHAMAVWGGAIQNQDGTVIARNSTFSANTASGGGALNNTTTTSQPNTSAQLTVQNCTVTANRAGSDGGGGIRHAGTNGVVRVKNTIVAADTSATTGPDLNGAFVSQGNNLIANSAGSSGFTSGANSDLVGGGANPVLNAGLGPLANNGGPTLTHALLSDSPAINGGDDAVAPKRDQRGYARSGISDIGAFEFNGKQFQVTAIAQSGSGLSIEFEAIAGETYRLERKARLTDPFWQTLAGVPDLVAGTTGPAQMTDPDEPTHVAAFYRVTILP